jgi:predicted 3-demethylubiquinone-9 3-methyltransferase (glyoxalase superfamily)
MKQKLTPCLWSDGKALEAAEFYVSIFPNSRITQTSYYSDAGPMPKGTVMMVAFELDGQEFTMLNGGPQYKFTEAVSFQIDCADQDEVDHYWNSLVAGGAESMCGWLKDKYGLSWQVVPRRLIELMTQPDAAKAKRVAEAMFTMRKIDIARIEAAARG